MSLRNKLLRKLAEDSYKPGQFSGVNVGIEQVVPAIARMIPGVNIPYAVGDLVGLGTGSIVDGDKESIAKLNDFKAASMLPGVANHRVMQRYKAMDKFHSGGKKGVSTVWSELLGSLASSIAAGLVGSAIGAGVGAIAGGEDGVAAGMKIGGATGAGLGLAAHSLGTLAGFVPKARTAKQHEEYLTSDPEARNYLVPGVAGYNLARRSRAMLDRTI